MAVSDDDIDRMVTALRNLYESSFRGKSRGRFTITRDDIRFGLGTEKLHRNTFEILQNRALEDEGLVITDLDDLFPVIEVKTQRGWRRTPKKLVRAYLE